ncbi:MAG: type II secretion system protein, partial [Planctomycetes bacterium]|nr:type II secretion system protein [Planctomycetota bacterium]
MVSTHGGQDRCGRGGSVIHREGPTLRRRSPSAFTLIEVLVVIAIIGLLIAVLVPAMAQAREAAKRVSCASSEKQIITAVHMYSQKYGGFVPFS